MGRETTDQAAFGELIRRYRRVSGLSQEELSERAGVSVRTITDLERGQRTRPYRRTVSAATLRDAIRGGRRAHEQPAAAIIVAQG